MTTGTKVPLAAGSLIAVATGFFVSAFEFRVGRIVAAGLLVGLLVITRRRLGPALMSPVWIITIGYLGLALGGAMFYSTVYDAEGGAGVKIKLTEQVTAETFWLIFNAVAALVIGASATSFFQKKRPQGAPALAVVRTSRRVNGLALRFAIVPPLMLVAGVGVGQILRRTDYLPGAVGGLRGPALILAHATALALGYLLTQRLATHQRIAVQGYILLYAALYFSFGTRMVALLPLLLAAGYYAGSLNRRSKVALALCALLSLYLVQLPLYVRSFDEHGLIPYAQGLPGFFSETLKPDQVAVTALVSFGAIGETAFVEPKLPRRDLWIALNPAPGQASGWYEVADKHRLNIFTPYPALGELGNAGIRTVIVYYLFLGVFLSYLDSRIRFYLRSNRPGIPLAILGLCGLFVLLSLQYNLRSANRLLLYALIVDFGGRAIRSGLVPMLGRPGPRQLIPANEDLPKASNRRR